MLLPESCDYDNILLHNASLLDVRSSLEFTQGTIPNATNLPILNDKERHQVGLCYKKNGQQQATHLGHELVHGAIKAKRIDAWIAHIRQTKTKHLYCFRGGLRSKITQQWLHESGVHITRVQGGYKALRQHLINELNKADQNFDFILTGGLTGCRKTLLVKQLVNGLDLEGAAYHRGSSFGAHAIAQNSQASFENIIGMELIRARNAQQKIITLEDEAKFIGSVDLPKNIYAKMRVSPIVVIESSIEERLQQLVQEYIIDMLNEYNALHTEHEQAFEAFSDYLLLSLQRIQKRLGGQRWQELNGLMTTALVSHKRYMDPQSHLIWLRPLIEKYYDPMYLSQLEDRSTRIIFKGDYQACHHFLFEYANTYNNN
jgi:tRNA 2-selenouridine synthase